MHLEKSKPKLSILLSAYNAEEYFQAAIESLMNQTFRDFELLIADDGSQDRTKSLINAYHNDPRVIISHNNQNNGKTETINRLYKLAKGNFVTIHDADDISLPERFAIQMAEFEKNPKLVMCGTWFNYVRKDGTFLFSCEPPTSYNEILNQIRHQSVFHGPTTIFKKEVTDCLDCFLRPFFNDFNEDADLNMRVAEMGECYNIPHYLYQYRVLPNSLSKSLTPRKLSMYKVVAHLAEQRKNQGKDDLQLNQEEKVEAFLRNELKIYESDDILALEKNAGKMLYFGLETKAIKIVAMALIKKPLSFKLFRLLIYCIRKWLLKN